MKAEIVMEELRTTLKLCTDSFLRILQLSAIYVWSQEIAHSRTQYAYFCRLFSSELFKKKKIHAFMHVKTEAVT